MKNKKGFVISTTLYSIFGIMLITVFYILYMLSNNRMILNTNIEDIKDGFNPIDSSVSKKITVYIDKNSEMEEYIKNKFNDSNIDLKIRNYTYNNSLAGFDVYMQGLGSQLIGSNGWQSSYVGTINDTVIFSEKKEGDLLKYRFCYVDTNNTGTYSCDTLSTSADDSTSTIPWQGIKFDSENNKIYLYSYNSSYSGASGTTVSTYKYYEYNYTDTVLEGNNTNLDIDSKKMVSYTTSTSSGSGYTCLGPSCISYGGSSSSVSSTKEEFDELKSKYNSGSNSITIPQNPLSQNEIDYIEENSQDIYNNIAISMGNWEKNYKTIEIADENIKWTIENNYIGFVSNLYVKLSGDYSSKLRWFPSIVWYRPEYEYIKVGVSALSEQTVDEDVDEYVVFINNNEKIRDDYDTCRFLEGLNDDIKSTYDDSYHNNIYLYGDDCVNSKFSEIYEDTSLYSYTDYSSFIDEKAIIDDLYNKVFPTS